MSSEFYGYQGRDRLALTFHHIDRRRLTHGMEHDDVCVHQMAASNPMLRQMLDSRPELRAMMSNPQVGGQLCVSMSVCV